MVRGKIDQHAMTNDSIQRQPVTTICYATGGTPGRREQNWDRVLRHAHDHGDENWLTDTDGNIEPIVEDVAEHMENVEPGNIVTWQENPPPAVTVEEKEQQQNTLYGQALICHDRNGSVSGLKAAANWVDNNRKNHIITLIVPHIDVLVNKNTGYTRIEHFLNRRCNVHFVESGVTIRYKTSVEGKTKRVLRTLSESISGSVKNGDTYEHRGGRPPLGYTVENSELVPDNSGNPSYKKVCDVLQQHKDGHVSERRASKKLDCARATIRNAINDRPELYGLE